MRQGLSDELYNAVADYRTDERFTPREKLAIEKYIKHGLAKQ